MSTAGPSASSSTEPMPPASHVMIGAWALAGAAAPPARRRATAEASFAGEQSGWRIILRCSQRLLRMLLEEPRKVQLSLHGLANVSDRGPRQRLFFSATPVHAIQRSASPYAFDRERRVVHQERLLNQLIG